MGRDCFGSCDHRIDCQLCSGNFQIEKLRYRGLWVLGMFVPLLNIIVAVRCVAAPEGYADHKTLDTTGKIIVGIVIALIALLILAVSFA